MLVSSSPVHRSREGQRQCEITAKDNGRMAWGACAGDLDSYALELVDIDGELDLPVSQIKQPKIVYCRHDGCAWAQHGTLASVDFDPASAANSCGAAVS